MKFRILRKIKWFEKDSVVDLIDLRTKYTPHGINDLEKYGFIKLNNKQI